MGTTAVTVAGGLMFIEHLLWAGALNVAIPFLLQQRCEDYGTLQRRTRGDQPGSHSYCLCCEWSGRGKIPELAPSFRSAAGLWPCMYHMAFDGCYKGRFRRQ